MSSFRNFFNNLFDHLIPRRDRTIQETVEPGVSERVDALLRDPATRNRVLSGDPALIGDLTEGLSPDEAYELEQELHRRRGSGGQTEGMIESEQVQDVVRSMRLNPASRVGRIAEAAVDFWRGLQGVFRRDRRDSLATQLAREIENAIPEPRVEYPRAIRRVSTDRGISNTIRESKRRMGELASSLRSGRITVDEFSSGMSAELRRLGLASLIMSVGGPGNLSGHHMGLLDRYLERQLGYLGQFVEEIRERLASGGSLSGRDVTRATMYASSAKPLYEEGYRQAMSNRFGDAMRERRILGAAEHCGDCVEYANLGWQPIGTLPPIGDSQCGQFCQCQFEYSLDGGQSTIGAGESPIGDA